jgi:hypothetical protein
MTTAEKVVPIGDGRKAGHFNWRRLRDPNQERCDNRLWRTELTALVMDNEEVREDGRRVCKNNLLALCYVLGYCLITEDVHHEALHFFPVIDESMTVENISAGLKRRRSLIYPRNTYKSTIDICFCVQLILHFFSTIAILILSGSKELAFAFVDQVASFFVKPTNRPPTLFQALFPELCVSKNPNSGEFTAALRQTEPKIIEPLIWGNSVESATTGWHPDVLICDDVFNNRNGQKFETRTRITKSYKLARKILKPRGIEMKIGTPYGVGDFLNDEVLTSRPGTYERIFKPALRLVSGDRLDPNGFPEEDEIELLFPEILRYEFLREEYESDYASFMSQYMLDTYGAAEIVFGEREILAVMVDENKVPMEGEYFISFRLPCKSQKWRKVSGAVGLMNRNRMYVVDVIQGNYKPSEMAKMMHDLARKFGLHRIAIEESPGARSMQPVIENHALTTGWPLYISWIEFEEDSGVRDTRIRSIEALIASERLLFSNGVKTKPLLTGFLEYGMMDETGLPDVISRLADQLPVSIASEEEDTDDAFRMAMENDRYNFVYGRGKYAPVEPTPEELAPPEPSIEDQRYTESGLEIAIPGLEW